MTERIWYQNPTHFITLENYNQFFPTNGMTFAEQLNSLFRLSIYFSLVVFVIKHDLNIFFVVAFVGLFTYLLYTLDTTNKTKEQLLLSNTNLDKDKNTGEICVKPTKDNPFMNILISDYATNTQRPKACKVSSKKVQKEIKTAFDDGLYRDIGDIFSKVASDRQWVTNPSTTIPNDRESLAKWLYGTGPTCKEGNGDQCWNLQYNNITPT